MSTSRSQFLASLTVYVCLTLLMGRSVLAQLGTGIASDAGDPLLTAAILHWNATHLPWTEAWYQFPSFHPTADVLTFSEHLLGVSVYAAPIDWLTGNPLVAYNLATLLTFVFSAAAMYALVFRLTRSGAGAFLAGLAFGFAPFRASHLPHLQMLASFWAPLSLLGLHAFIETGRRRWLALYGAAWALQAMANAYTVVLFSLLVGLWVVWFVVAQRRWRDLAGVVVATGLAAVPLVPILRTYIEVHGRHGFSRSLDEMRAFSADVAGVLCAPQAVEWWSWLRIGCRPEGEAFPGVALAALCTAALVLGWRRQEAPQPGYGAERWFVRASRACLALSAVYAGIVASAIAWGPWRIEWGPIHASVVSLRRPTEIMLVALIAGAALSPNVRGAVRRASPTAFYLAAAIVTWVLSLGPRIIFLGASANQAGPFALLLQLPGVSGLRVPARFWLMSVLCLSVVAGLFVAKRLASWSQRGTALAVAVLGLLIVLDGWPGRIGVESPPAPVPNPGALRGGVALELPMGTSTDVAAQYHAVVGGWRSVNGYSGYSPAPYWALTSASEQLDDSFFRQLTAEEDVHVIVPRGASAIEARIAARADAALVGENQTYRQYRIAKITPAPSAVR